MVPVGRQKRHKAFLAPANDGIDEPPFLPACPERKSRRASTAVTIMLNQ
jgi:hypothetical protein